MTQPRGGRRRTDPAPLAVGDDRLRQQTDTLHAMVGHIHDYWLRTFGEPPKSEDSMVIVGVIAALDEYHAQTCASASGLRTIKLPSQKNPNAVTF